VLHFKVGPFPVSVYPWFFISAVLLGSGSGFGFGWRMFAWIAIVFAGVLGHELGHAVIGRALGGRPEIRLEAFGGVTFPRLVKPPSPARQFLLSVAGPLFGLLLAGLAWGVLRVFPPAPESPAAWVTGVFIYVSILWAGFNLLPILPLDGGQMMLAVLEGVRKRPSLALASWLSLAAIVVTGVWLTLARGLDAFLLVFLGLFALQNFRQAQGASRGDAAPSPAPVAAEDATERADVAAASAEAREALLRRDLDSALAAAARLEGAGGPFRQAAALRLRAGIELSRGDNESAAMFAGQSFSIWQSADAAVVAARANLRAGAEDRARNWLRRAVEAGAAPAAVRADPELGAIA
jgi:stage IV sporulation protein FB